MQGVGVEAGEKRKREDASLVVKAEPKVETPFSTPTKNKFSKTVKVKITDYYAQEEEQQAAKRQRVKAKFAERRRELTRSLPPAGVVHREDGRGSGAFFDHQTLRAAAGEGASTVRIAKTEAVSQQQLNQIWRYMQAEAVQVLGAVGEDGVPEAKDPEADDYGFLFIPGASRRQKKEPSYQFRLEHNLTLIKLALRRGQPMLAICGGLWELWLAAGGRLKKVKDHAYSTSPRIITGGKVGYNRLVHRIAFQPGSEILRSFMGIDHRKTSKDWPQPAVNSLHWLAIDAPMDSDAVREEGDVTDRYSIAAVSIADPELAPKRRDGSGCMLPEPCVEAIESKCGAPVIGVQWHPEAMSDMHSTPEQRKMHLGIIRGMYTAGQAYCNKRKLLPELRSPHSYPHQLRRLQVAPTASDKHFIGFSWKDETDGTFLLRPRHAAVRLGNVYRFENESLQNIQLNYLQTKLSDTGYLLRYTTVAKKNAWRVVPDKNHIKNASKIRRQVDVRITQLKHEKSLHPKRFKANQLIAIAFFDVVSPQSEKAVKAAEELSHSPV